MKLHEDKDLFKDLIISTAENRLGLQRHQVEKDYFVSLFLKELSQTDDEFEIVFKGGTSLSKCYDVINRFSEDVDLTIVFNNEKAGRGIKKRLKNKIIVATNKCKMQLLNFNDIQSDRNFNHYDVKFERVFEATTEMIPFIKIETIVAYKPYPYKKRPISNYVSKYLKSDSVGEQIIEKYELKEFEMNVQSIERTFIDKLLAICDYHLAKKYERYSRHIYDIHMIWQSKQLEMSVVYNIVEDVIKDRQRFSELNLAAKPGSKIKDILKEIINQRVYEKDYIETTALFIYDKVEYKESIQSIIEISQTDILPDVVKRYQ